MNVLLTGASSFTGYWFARELAAAGHHIVAPLRRTPEAYSGVRAERVHELSRCAEIVWSSVFGESQFLNLIAREKCDLLCHHAARVENYRSQDFDVVTALAENTKEIPRVLHTLRETGLKAVVLTGSVFEPDEGAGTEPLRAFSPYGVSKALTASVVRYWCEEFDLPLGKFVIPNPFGPLEEERFCAHLVKTWNSGAVAEVKTPDYVRDNIHVDLLAKAYRKFAEATSFGPAFAKCNPSGYVESQGAFALRFAAEIGPRLGLKADVKLCKQIDFAEPMVRINADRVDRFEWDETAAWDGIAEFYRRRAHHGPSEDVAQ